MKAGRGEVVREARRVLMEERRIRDPDPKRSLMEGFRLSEIRRDTSFPHSPPFKESKKV